MLICISDVTCGKVVYAPHLRREEKTGDSQFAESASNFFDGACKKSSRVITGFLALSVIIMHWQMATGGMAIILSDHAGFNPKKELIHPL